MAASRKSGTVRVRSPLMEKPRKKKGERERERDREREREREKYFYKNETTKKKGEEFGRRGAVYMRT